MKRANFITTALVVAAVMGILSIAVTATAQGFCGYHHRHHGPTIMPFLPPPPPVMTMPFRMTFGGNNWRVTIGSSHDYGGYGHYGYYDYRHDWDRGYGYRHWGPRYYRRPMDGPPCAAYIRWLKTGRR